MRARQIADALDERDRYVEVAREGQVRSGQVGVLVSFTLMNGDGVQPFGRFDFPPLGVVNYADETRSAHYAGAERNDLPRAVVRVTASAGRCKDWPMLISPRVSRQMNGMPPLALIRSSLGRSISCPPRPWRKTGRKAARTSSSFGSLREAHFLLSPFVFAFAILLIGCRGARFVIPGGACGRGRTSGRRRPTWNLVACKSLHLEG